jgi:uncharacterized protein YjbJ (UPF0337 family)
MAVKDQIKGMIDDATGRAKRQVGEWTGDTNAQVDGAMQQVKGKSEKALGKVKDAAKDIQDKLQRDNYKRNTEAPATKRP